MAKIVKGSRRLYSTAAQQLLTHRLIALFQYGPGDVIADLPDSKHEDFGSQRIPRLIHTLTMAMQYNMSVMFDLSLPPEGHPYRNVTWRLVDDVIKITGFDKAKVCCLIKWFVFDTTPSLSVVRASVHASDRQQFL